MIFAIYGVSRSGKDYLIQKIIEYFNSNGIELLHVNGSKTLNELSNKKFKKLFKQLTEDEKKYLRIAFIEHIQELEKTNSYIVVDGHYSFYDVNNKLISVFTDYDKKCYDKFFYLDTNSKTIKERLAKSIEEKKNTTISEKDIATWKDYEIKELTKHLLGVNKELHIVKFDSDICLEYIFDVVTSNRYDSNIIAQNMLKSINITSNTVILTDCDKTLSKEDSTQIALDCMGKKSDYLKELFNGDRYSNFQMLLAKEYYKEIGLFDNSAISTICKNITINQTIIEDLRSKSNAQILAITSGCCLAWKNILQNYKLNAIVLDGNGIVSKYVKYYVAKLLREAGKHVIAIGDSMLDSLMLCEANIGYLVTKGYRDSISNFLKENNKICQLSYFDYKYAGVKIMKNINNIKTLDVNAEIEKLIRICKSNSNINGRQLRVAHNDLGGKIAELIKNDYPKEEFIVVVMMRSGLCFGMGIADTLDCPILFFDNKNIEDFNKQISENPKIKKFRMIICDGVINTGKSIVSLANNYLQYRPILASNVISNKFNNTNLFPIYATRISSNSYEGAKQTIVLNGKGPDTSDRLFKLI